MASESYMEKVLKMSALATELMSMECDQNSKIDLEAIQTKVSKILDGMNGGDCERVITYEPYSLAKHKTKLEGCLIPGISRSEFLKSCMKYSTIVACANNCPVGYIVYNAMSSVKNGWVSYISMYSPGGFEYELLKRALTDMLNCGLVTVTTWAKNPTQRKWYLGMGFVADTESTVTANIDKILAKIDGLE